MQGCGVLITGSDTAPLVIEKNGHRFFRHAGLCGQVCKRSPQIMAGFRFASVTAFVNEMRARIGVLTRL